MLVTLGPESRHTIVTAERLSTLPTLLEKRSSYFLKTRARGFHGSSSGLHLSIKAAVAGKALYETNNGRYMPDQDAYLILNPGQPLSITVDENTDAIGLLIYFAEGFAGEIYRNLTATAGLLLDQPQMPVPAQLEFVQRLYSHDEILSPSLQLVSNALNNPGVEPAWYEEQLHRIMVQLIRVHLKVCKEIASLPALRPATREEIYRRVYRARDYMAASIDQPLSISEVARVACLSPNHFLRAFRQVFRTTPYQYLTDLRLTGAKQLLEKTDYPITEICFRVGFESLGSFSWLFHRRTGISPQSYRRQN
jgi:AraC family transcriptional regulator